VPGRDPSGRGAGAVACPVAYWGMKVLLYPIFRLFWRVRIEGRHNVPKKGAAVLAANHQSFCDSLFLPLAVTRRVTYLAKAEYFDSWKTAWFFRAVGQIPVRRGGGDASERALATAREVLGRGHIVGLYPEGTRADDRAVHRGRTGVARLAMECGVPVIPVGVDGTDRVQPIGQRWLRPFQRVTIRFGPPMLLERSAVETVPIPDATGGDQRAIGTAALRKFTDELMLEIARLAGRQYSDEHVSRAEPAS
jgi:1-acyl-sn-glycerol-3-phosphate acyltransferase